MQRRTLGRTGLEVSVLSIGGLYTSSLAGGADETRRILRRAIDLGINAVDTAPAYADSEATLGLALRDVTDPLIVMTKLGGRPQPFDPRDPAALRSSVEESLRLLHRDRIDVLFVHEPDRPLQYPWWTRYDPLDGPVLTVLDVLKRAGTVGFGGLAGTTVTELTALIRSDRFDVVLTAFNDNALFREARSTVIPAAAERDIGVVLASVYGQGCLTRRADTEVRASAIWLAAERRVQLLAYYDLLDQAGLSAAELCLRYAIAEPHVATIPIGCKSVEHLEQSVCFADRGPLPGDVSERLDEIAAMVPRRPFEEPMILPLGRDYAGPGPANVAAAVPVGRLTS